jgi:hypothetical protein
MIRSVLSSLLAGLLFAAPGLAQEVATARLIRTSVILDQPRGDGFVVITVPPGVVVEVLGQQGQWYQVRLLAEFNATRPSGWVHRDVIELLPSPGSTTPAVPLTSPDATPPQSPEPRSKTPVVREGVWFNIGLGYGSLGCENCDGRIGGVSGGLAVGGTVSDKVLLAVGTTGWYKSEDGNWLSAGVVDGRVRFYPSVSSGFFVTGGIGIGTISLGVARIGSERETGFGLTLGVGWDVRVGSNVSLTPFWNADSIRTSNADANFWQFGLGVTIH